MKRPLIPIALLYVVGILAGWLWTVSLSVLFGLAFLLLIVAVAWPRARPLLIWPLVILVGWINLSHRTAILASDDLRNLLPQPDRVVVRGVLPELPQHRAHVNRGRDFETTTSQLDITAININGQGWQPALGTIVTHTTGALPKDFFGGQTVEIEGDIGPPDPPVAEGLFDYPAYLRHQGIYYVLRVKDPAHWRIVASPARPPLAERFDEWARRTVALGLPVEDLTLHLEWALTLGWKAALTEEVSEPFMHAATYHIFAVDGLRIAIVSGIVIAVLRVLSVPRWLCGVIASVVIICYAGLTGWQPSAMRAIVMAMVVFLGWCLHRPRNLLNSLALAATLILLYEPRELFQAGFQLSVGVVLCIVLIMPFFDDLGKWLLRVDPLLPDELRPWWQKIFREGVRWTIGLFLTSLAAWLGSIPLVAYYFHLITPASGPANLLAVPLCGFVLISNLSSLLLGAWFPFGAELFNHAGWFLMRCIEITSHWSANWPAAYYYVPAPGRFTIFVYYVLLLSTLTGWLFRKKWRAWRIAAVTMPTLTWCVLWLQHDPAARLTILALNGAHAVHVRASGHGNEWLIDCGEESRVNTVTKPFLRAQGVNRMPNFILTHGEKGYTGGAGLVTQSFHPKNIYTSSFDFRSPTYREFRQTNQLTLEWRPPLKAGDHLGPWTILHPSGGDRLPRAEDNALVLRGEINGTSILLLSDLGRAGQRTLLEQTNNLRSDIVVAAIPSDGEPLGDTLLDAIQPRVIIIADSPWPATRRADKKLKTRLAQRNIPVIYESDAGSVTLELLSGDWTGRAADGSGFSSKEPALRMTAARADSLQRTNDDRPPTQ